MARFLKKGFTSFINFLKNKIRNIKNRRAVDNKENVKLTKIDKKKNKELLKLERKNIYLKESLLFSIIFTLIDTICFYKFSFANILTIFDNSMWNLIVTISLTLLVLLIATYIVDYVMTEIMIKKYNKKILNTTK